MSRSLVSGSILAAAVAAAIPWVNLRAVPTTADAYIPATFVPGTPTGYTDPTTALGNLTGDTGYGGLNPFNPTFSTSQSVILGEGGSLTLHLSRPVAPNGVNLGVYSNVGYMDFSNDASGLTDANASLFNQASRAVVSVSQDGVTFVALNGGQPITFDKPTNYYLNSSIDPTGYEFIPPNAQLAGQSKPSLVPTAGFANSTFDQIKTTLNGSAGGTWLDLRGTVPTAVNYVKFTVPAGNGDRMAIDALGALGAANTLTAGGRVTSEDVGSGAHTSDIVVDFGPASYDFKVHYDGSISGQQALQLLAANSDFKFSVHTYSFGDLVSGMDYGGYADTGLGSNGSDYWKYFTGNGTTWTSSGQGAGTRMLTDGSYDGWLWGLGHAGTPNFATVPEPASGAMLLVAGALILRRRNRT